jgi:DNA-binding PadR family transcriptional regulator
VKNGTKGSRFNSPLVGIYFTSMREPTFLILAALAAGPAHGYGVLQTVIELSEGRVRLRAGTLYAALDRLGSEGLIAAHGEEVVEGRLRRYYAITDLGLDQLAAQIERFEANAAAARRQLSIGMAGA